MKRLWTLVSAVLIAFLLSGIPVFATDVPTISVGTVADAKAGSSVTVDVSISSNPGIGALTFAIDYDHSRLLLTGFEDGGLTGWLVGVGQGEKANWTTTDFANNNTCNGTILKLTFSVLEDADGAALVRITDEDAVDVNAEEVLFSTEAGQVKITGGQASAPAAGTSSSLPSGEDPVTAVPGQGALQEGTVPEGADEAFSARTGSESGRSPLGLILAAVCLTGAASYAGAKKHKKEKDDIR